ncbi:MAG: hypothetical protein AVDCRST_MAG41-698, partial [uncultured Corynebacteriales bacterium]
GDQGRRQPAEAALPTEPHPADRGGVRPDRGDRAAVDRPADRRAGGGHDPGRFPGRVGPAARRAAGVRAGRLGQLALPGRAGHPGGVPVLRPGVRGRRAHRGAELLPVDPPAADQGADGGHAGAHRRVRLRQPHAVPLLSLPGAAGGAGAADRPADAGRRHVGRDVRLPRRLLLADHPGRGRGVLPRRPGLPGGQHPERLLLPHHGVRAAGDHARHLLLRARAHRRLPHEGDADRDPGVRAGPRARPDQGVDRRAAAVPAAGRRGGRGGGPGEGAARCPGRL